MPLMPGVPIRYRRQQRGQFAQQLQHAIPSLVVLADGISHLQHDPHGSSLALGLAEVAASALVIGSVVRRFKQLRAAPANAPHDAHASHGVDWIDIFLGVMLIVEVVAKYHATGHLARPTLLLSVALITIGLSHGRIAAWGDRRRELRVTDDGISVPGRFFRRLNLAWADVAEITIGRGQARVIARDGREQGLDLTDIIDADAVRHALSDALARLDTHRAALEHRHLAG
jgi:hypothetical protein